jgi:RimJ/RimL family protein N-acetyltransferase
MMVAFLKPAAAAQLNGPMIETKRLLLRMWRETDVAPNTAMLSDPASGRYITPDHKPITSEIGGWRNAATIAGHWALYGYGMFAVEEKASGRYVGRVGPWRPPPWPGFEVGWGIASEFRGKGYAVEAARASIGWVFENIDVDHVIHCIVPDNVASQSVARKLGAAIDRQADLLGDRVDLWITKRSGWRAAG